MKKVELNKPESDIVYLDDISESTPIFAKADGKLARMLVKEDNGWILRMGGHYGAFGYYNSRESTIKAALSCGYTFFIEE